MVFYLNVCYNHDIYIYILYIYIYMMSKERE
jgi:hypothetical protein